MKATVLVLLVAGLLSLAPNPSRSSPAAAATEFVFTGFAHDNLTSSGAAIVTPSGVLQLTNQTNEVFGHGFFPTPLRFKDATSNGAPLSFSTTFVFSITPRYPDAHGHGLAFALAPSPTIPRAVAGKNLGLFNTSNHLGTSRSEVVAVELDTAMDEEFSDINDNHVGIDVNSLKSDCSNPAAYFVSGAGEKPTGINLVSGDLFQVWIEYDGRSTRLEVTISPTGVPRPVNPLVSCFVNLSSVIADDTYVGFSAANGAASSSHYVLGWSFRLGPGRSPELDLSKLPRPPSPSRSKTTMHPQLLLSLILLAIVALLLVSAGITLFVTWRRRFAEEEEDWEIEYGPHRISYKDLHDATRGFRDVIGVGGFGTVYHGVLPRSGGVEVAVKKVAHDSRQGLREFVSEIVSMSRLRHRNLVHLLGYCRRRGELILVYDYMVNGSLDKHLFVDGDNNNKPVLSWQRRAKIVRDVAAGLLYLHEGWEQVVVHRDIKAGNVLLDAEMNGKLSDFGLARLYDHGGDSTTTHVIGTFGYLAPEMVKTGKATPSADVFAFGAFLLEVACAKRPMESLSRNENSNGDTAVGLVENVLECWKAGRIRDAMDPRMGKCDEEDVELVLKLGLLCSHPDHLCRPSMRQVVQILEGGAPVPETPPEDLGRSGRIFGHYETFDEFVDVFSTTIEMTTVAAEPNSSRSSAEHQQLISD